MIRVSNAQKDNSLLNYLPAKCWRFEKLPDFDYTVNNSVNLLYLTVSFHRKYPDYIYQRLNAINERSATDRASVAADRGIIVLILINRDDYEAELQDLIVSLEALCLVARSYQEAAQYLLSFNKIKDVDTKGLQGVKKKEPQGMPGQAAENAPPAPGPSLHKNKSTGQKDFLSAIPWLSKGAIFELSRGYLSLQSLISTKKEKLIKIKGIGPIKADELLEYFEMPFQED